MADKEQVGNELIAELWNIPAIDRDGLAAAVNKHLARLVASGQLTEEQYLLMVLAEEAAEVAQRAMKALRFGMYEVQPGQDRDNALRLKYELNDLIAVADMVFPTWQDADAYAAKHNKVAQFMDYSRQLGIVEGTNGG